MPPPHWSAEVLKGETLLSLKITFLLLSINNEHISERKYTIISQIEMIVIEFQIDNIFKMVLFHYNISMTQIWIVSLFEAQLTTVPPPQVESSCTFF